MSIRVANTMAVAIGLLVVLPACEQAEPVVYDQQNWQGSVDPNLPEALQAKQDAIIRLFTAIQQVGFKSLRINWLAPATLPQDRCRILQNLAVSSRCQSLAAPATGVYA